MRPIRPSTALTLAAGLFATAIALGVCVAPRATAEEAAVERVERPTDQQIRADVRKKLAYEGGEYELTLGHPSGANAEKTLKVHSVEYPSAYTSKYPDPNDTVRGRFFIHDDPLDAAVIVLGGWRYDPLTPEIARQVSESRIQTLYIDLPFQARRTPSGKRPGELTFSDDLEQNEDTFVQAALDVARARDWLIHERNVPAERIGIMGTSLGGFVAANLFGMEDQFRCAVIHLAGGDVAGVIFNGNRLTQNVVASLRAKGVTEKQVREHMRGMTPTLWARPGQQDRLLFVAAERDTVVPLQSVRDLAEAWGGSEVQVLRGVGHISPDEVRANVPRVRAYLERVLLAPSPATTPAASTPATGSPGTAPATPPAAPK